MIIGSRSRARARRRIDSASAPSVDDLQRGGQHRLASDLAAAAHKAEAVKGGAKKTAGRATDSPRLEAESRGDQAKGNLKQAKVKDALKH